MFQVMISCMYVLAVVDSLCGDMLWFLSIHMSSGGCCYCHVFAFCMCVCVFVLWLSFDPTIIAL